MTAYMQFFVHVYASRFFSLFFHCVSVCVCVFFIFYGSLWSDSNKERKKEKLHELLVHVVKRLNRSNSTWASEIKAYNSS